ncbi:MAG: 2-phosphosulfolactate phosphatase [Sarcina sp.]
MKIDVVISADYIKKEDLKGKAVIVIDVLRATSVITTAIANGATKVIPKLTVEEAFEEKEKLIALGEKVLLGGERQALKIEGFDCTNSPLEYKKEVVNGKVVLLSTTNGTRALTLASKGEVVLVASLLNAKAVAEKLVQFGKDIVIINSGTNGEFSMDDFICGGYIIDLVTENVTCDLTDISKMAKNFYCTSIDIRETLKDAKHYGVLKSLGLERDLEYCLTKDIYDYVPEYKNFEII